MKKLNAADRERLLEYVSREPEMNLFFIGDVENYGLESDTVSVYAFLDGEEWEFVLLRYFDFYLIYSPKKRICAELAAEFLKGRTVECISGKTELVRQMTSFYPQFSLQDTYMCRCAAEDLKRNEAGGCASRDRKRAENCAWSEAVEIKLCCLNRNDVSELLGLYRQIEEFSSSYKDLEKARERLLADMGNGEIMVGIRENGHLVSVAATSASNSQSAMVVGVATLPGYRGRGYASQAVRELCRVSFSEGRKFLCLFYDNPAAGRIYHRIGFREIGSYAMLR